MRRPWNGLERRASGDVVDRRARVRAAWPDVRVESVDHDARGGDGAACAWIRLGELAPADVVVELVTPSNRACRMWCAQSYHNGSFLYTTGMACTADDMRVEEGEPETWMVRITAARMPTGVPDLPPVVGGGARITSGSAPARAPAARIRCGA